MATWRCLVACTSRIAFRSTSPCALLRNYQRTCWCQGTSRSTSSCGQSPRPVVRCLVAVSGLQSHTCLTEHPPLDVSGMATTSPSQYPVLLGDLQLPTNAKLVLHTLENYQGQPFEQVRGAADWEVCEQRRVRNNAHESRCGTARAAVLTPPRLPPPDSAVQHNRRRGAATNDHVRHIQQLALPGRRVLGRRVRPTRLAQG